MTIRLLEATWTILDQKGYKRLKADAVCREAQAGKAAFYRRWPNVEAMVLDAIREHPPSLPVPNTGTLRGDLLEILHPWLRPANIDERVSAQLVGVSHHSPPIRAALQAVVRTPLEDMVAHVVTNHVSRGHDVLGVQRRALTMVVASMWWDRGLACLPPLTQLQTAELVDLVLLPIVAGNW